MNDDDRAFVAQKLGEMRGELTKLIASLNLVTPVQVGHLANRNRYLLYTTIGLVLLSLGLQVAIWLGR